MRTKSCLLSCGRSRTARSVVASLNGKARSNCAADHPAARAVPRRSAAASTGRAGAAPEQQEQAGRLPCRAAWAGSSGGSASRALTPAPAPQGDLQPRREGQSWVWRRLGVQERPGTGHVRRAAGARGSGRSRHGAATGCGLCGAPARLDGSLWLGSRALTPLRLGDTGRAPLRTQRHTALRCRQRAGAGLGTLPGRSCA